jgi:putative membrane protein
MDEQGMEAAKRRADPDSRARTHLANERTFLAWLRTGLSLVALGLGAAQFLERDLVPGVPVTMIFALVLVGGGVGITLVGGIHYLHARDDIEAGAFLPSTRAAVAAVTLVIVAGVLALALVVLLRIRA